MKIALKSAVLALIFVSAAPVAGASACESITLNVVGDNSNLTVICDKKEEISNEEWVYIGHRGKQYNFQWSGRLLQGVTISATTNVNIRADHIRWSNYHNNWRNAQKVGVFRFGQTAQVKEIVTVDRDFIWARIR